MFISRGWKGTKSASADLTSGFFYLLAVVKPAQAGFVPLQARLMNIDK